MQLTKLTENPALRGSSLLFKLATGQHANTDGRTPKFQISAVHYCAGHYAVCLQGGHYLCVLDTVPPEHESHSAAAQLWSLLTEAEARRTSLATHGSELSPTKPRSANSGLLLLGDERYPILLLSDPSAPLLGVHFIQHTPSSRLRLLLITASGRAEVWVWRPDSCTWASLASYSLYTSPQAPTAVFRQLRASLLVGTKAIVFLAEESHDGIAVVSLYALQLPVGGHSPTTTASHLCTFKEQEAPIALEEAACGCWLIFRNTISLLSITAWLASPHLTLFQLASTLLAAKHGSESAYQHPYRITYVQYCIHPISKELLLLTNTGVTLVCSPSTANADDIVGSATTTPPVRIAVRRLSCLQSASDTVPWANELQLSFMQLHSLVVIGSESLTIFDARTGVRVGELAAPRELREEAAAGTSYWNLWRLHGTYSAASGGLHGLYHIFLLEFPSILQLQEMAAVSLVNLQNSVVEKAANGSVTVPLARAVTAYTQRGLLRVARTCKEWGLSRCQTQHLLEIVVAYCRYRDLRHQRDATEVSPGPILETDLGVPISFVQAFALLPLQQVLAVLEENLETPAFLLCHLRTVAERTSLRCMHDPAAGYSPAYYTPLHRTMRSFVTGSLQSTKSQCEILPPGAISSWIGETKNTESKLPQRAPQSPSKPCAPTLMDLLALSNRFLAEVLYNTNNQTQHQAQELCKAFGMPNLLSSCDYSSSSSLRWPPGITWMLKQSSDPHDFSVSIIENYKDVCPPLLKFDDEEKEEALITRIEEGLTYSTPPQILANEVSATHCILALSCGLYAAGFADAVCAIVAILLEHRKHAAHLKPQVLSADCALWRANLCSRLLAATGSLTAQLNAKAASTQQVLRRAMCRAQLFLWSGEPIQAIAGLLEHCDSALEGSLYHHAVVLLQNFSQSTPASEWWSFGNLVDNEEATYCKSQMFALLVQFALRRHSTAEEHVRLLRDLWALLPPSYPVFDFVELLRRSKPPDPVDSDTTSNMFVDETKISGLQAPVDNFLDIFGHMARQTRKRETAS